MQKKVLIIAIFGLLITNCYSQGDLQFNRVINIKFDKIGNGSNVINTDTTINVPAGKVWKIEAAEVSYINSINNWYNQGKIAVDNAIIVNKDGGSTAFPLAKPVWLYEGDHNIKFFGASYSASTRSMALLSIIEFNVIP